MTILNHIYTRKPGRTKEQLTSKEKSQRKRLVIELVSWIENTTNVCFTNQLSIFP